MSRLAILMRACSGKINLELASLTSQHLSQSPRPCGRLKGEVHTTPYTMLEWRVQDAQPHGLASQPYCRVCCWASQRYRHKYSTVDHHSAANADERSMPFSFVRPCSRTYALLCLKIYALQRFALSVVFRFGAYRCASAMLCLLLYSARLQSSHRCLL